jgi:hypothetical protein
MSNHTNQDHTSDQDHTIDQAGHADPHDAHDVHGVQAGNQPADALEELPKPPLTAFIWPLIILLIVGLAVLPMVAGAFSSTPREPIFETENNTGQEAGPSTGEVTIPATPAPATPPSSGPDVPTVIPLGTNARTAEPTNVLGPATVVAGTATVAPVTETPVPTASPVVVVPPVMGDMEQGAARMLEFAGQTFKVESTEIVADWQFSAQPGVVSWINGTVFNYVMGLPYSADNAALFKTVKPNDTLRITVATGDVLTFRVSDVRRVGKDNTAALAQDHPGVTLLLVGEPGVEDRAQVQAQYAPQALGP